jgi:hydroxymethylglutaryl-CoA synthase
MRQPPHAEASAHRHTVGIDAIALALPRGYIDLADLAEARGVSPAKFQSGLGVNRMAIASPDEDPVSLGVNAARRLFRRAAVSPADIGLCVTGTETAVDHSKPVGAYLHGQLGLASTCRTFETKHACFGGTAGLLAAVDWVSSGAARGRSALVVCTDIARYAVGSAGEPTQGAGAVAMIIRENPRLIEIEAGESGSYTRDVHDFWRPLHAKDALVDGHFSVQCYLDALAGAYGEWRRLPGATREPLARTCYHVPYGKMARKAHRHRLGLDGLSEVEADATFTEQVGASLELPAEVGNVYTGSLYLALASLLHREVSAIAGRRIGLFSYGSGCTAEFFAGRVHPDAAAMVQELQIAEPLEGRRRFTIDEYEAIRREDASADRRCAPAGSAPSGPDADRPNLDKMARFAGVDASDRRVYEQR